jgi:hypothetical protein
MTLEEIRTREELRAYIAENGQYKLAFAKAIADEGEFQCLMVRRLSGHLAHAGHKTQHFSRARNYRDLKPLIPFIERALDHLKTAVASFEQLDADAERGRLPLAAE